jgi:hypothetical protein
VDEKSHNSLVNGLKKHVTLLSKWMKKNVTLLSMEKKSFTSKVSRDG